MIDGLKPYPAMKNSGVEWLDEVPAHWEVVATKRVYEIQLGKMLQNRPTSSDDIEVPYLKAQHVQWFHVRTAEAPTMWASAVDVVQYGLAEGDLLVCEGGEGGRCGVVKDEVNGFIMQNALHRVRPRNQSRNDFLQYFMSAVAAAGWFDAINDKATIAHFTGEKFGALEVSVPPPSEQTAIVRFLNHADARIQRYIRAKEKLLALLEEHKQAVIHQAVTGQIDVRTGERYPAYKDSGVEWIGEVPAHWDVVTIGAMSKLIQTGPFGSQLHSREYVTLGTPVINPSHMEAGRLKSSATVTIGSEKVNELSRHRFRVGDVVIARRGDLGRCALVMPAEEGWICGTGSLLLRCKASVIPEFFQAVFSSRGGADMLSLSSVGSTMANLSAGVVARQRLALPPFGEQQGIVHSIRDKVDRVAGAISRLEQEIELLLEYRTRLLADVVTGKLDVREAANALPEEPKTQNTASHHVEGVAVNP